ncbi:PREDICTED: sarcolemmal membrane-associated protein isoform X2 [Nicrophorus vespilloides]|uniref:Sarcolemmal membrane-associated protein isoform X2 n=1 Tax=Nicrophorus vespilloides TaxID=110193 RepID=A0ABM1M777_NICVS|nr:PREDICTED: sarcolemmal membrane-associated protein isoform X2 [Nicrophorus vespilloides]
MVVVSESWMKNIQYESYLMNNSNSMVIPATNTMTAKAVLICRENSHPFQDRTLSLEEPIKIGRSVARARSTPTNAIFDCKVLSRHHALLWYENGKFFLQDTKSSNGTFVNNNKLSSVESESHEVSSGDIVQFGVDVVENNNRKVTHGCIIATLKLYLPDGKEAKASPSFAEGNRHGVVPLDELYKLNQIIQEASQREQCLEKKLRALQRVVDSTRQAADESWQACVVEERLLSRIATLEKQLSQANKGSGDDRLREEITKLQEDRTQYQTAAKEVLRKLHADRLAAVARATEQERSRISAENESLLAKEQLEQVQTELQEVAQKLTEAWKKADEERLNFTEKEKELQDKLEEELKNIDKLQNNEFKQFENEEGEGDQTNRNVPGEPQQNHINLTVAPVSEHVNNNNQASEEDDDEEDDDDSTDCNSVNEVNINDCEPEESENKDELVKGKENEIEKKEECELADEVEEVRRPKAVDTRTLKYHNQSAQNELKKQIEQMSIVSCADKTKIALLEKSLMTEKETISYLTSKQTSLKEDLAFIEAKYVESASESDSLKKKIEALQAELSKAVALTMTTEKATQIDQLAVEKSDNISQVQELEEDLVSLKERYAAITEEKIAINKDMLNLHDKYNALRDRSHNVLFCYIAPLVLMVLYLLISSMFS